MALTPPAGRPRPGLRSAPPGRLTRRLTAVTTSAALALAGLAALAPAGGVGPVTTAAAAPPAVTVTSLMTGLNLPWDVLPLPEGQLTAERGGRVLFRSTAGTVSTVRVVGSGLWVSGETGRMDLAQDPAYSSGNRRVYSCEGYDVNGARGVRVVQWKLGLTSPITLTRERVIKSSLPVTSGRHGGCRIAFTPGGSMLIGTGDAAVGTNPQDLNSLGGKVLRLDPRTSKPIPDNPYYSRGGNARFVYTFGHRNVQGLAIRPGGQIYTAEHGSDRDDEVNLVRWRANFGWNPVPGYNESVSMTDTRLTTGGATVYQPVWRSGSPTVATGGIAFLKGSAWGDWEGSLAVAELKGQGIRVLTLDASGKVVANQQMAALDNTFGRIRSVEATTNGLYVTTANGGGSDRVLLVRPRG